MKLLLKRDIPKLGNVGDVVDVSVGYARNYLIPEHLGVAPTAANMRAVEEVRKQAVEHRRLLHEGLKREGERLAGKEFNIIAAANEEGVLYGSVGAREIAAALRLEGYAVEAQHVMLREPIKKLDNVPVELRLAEDMITTIKIWVVRDKGAEPIPVKA